MSRDLELLTLQQLIALGFQNAIKRESRPNGKNYREYLITELDSLKVIRGLETNEDGS